MTRPELREPPLLHGENLEKAIEPIRLDYSQRGIFIDEEEEREIGAKAQRQADIKWMKEHCYLKAEGELPKYLYHTVLGMSKVTPGTIRDFVKTIMMYGLTPQVPDEWANLLPSFLREEPVVWLSDGIYQGFQRGRILRITAGLLDDMKLFKVESPDVNWWVYAGIIPPHLISRVIKESDMSYQAGHVAVEPLIKESKD